MGISMDEIRSRVTERDFEKLINVLGPDGVIILKGSDPYLDRRCTVYDVIWIKLSRLLKCSGVSDAEGLKI